MRIIAGKRKGLNIKTPKVPERVTPQFYQQLIDLAGDQSYTETVNKVMAHEMGHK